MYVGMIMYADGLLPVVCEHDDDDDDDTFVSKNVAITLQC
jgi:hypothetical protein